MGSGYVLKDLGSANGTYVNGIKVTEQELSGEDVIKIGDTEFSFKAVNQDYFAQESQGQFLQVAESENELQQQQVGGSLDVIPDPLPDLIPEPMPMQDMNSGMIQPQSAILGASSFGADPAQATQETAPVKKGPLAKFWALPKEKRRLYIIIGCAFFGMLAMLQMDEEDKLAAAKKKKQQESSLASDPKNVMFQKLPKEKREFIDQTYNLALDYLTKHKYDQAIYEADKILEILADGYKDIKDIKSYAQRGAETLKAMSEEEEKKKNEEKMK